MLICVLNFFVNMYPFFISIKFIIKMNRITKKKTMIKQWTEQPLQQKGNRGQSNTYGPQIQ